MLQTTSDTIRLIPEQEAGLAKRLLELEARLAYIEDELIVATDDEISLYTAMAKAELYGGEALGDIKIDIHLDNSLCIVSSEYPHLSALRLTDTAALLTTLDSNKYTEVLENTLSREEYSSTGLVARRKVTLIEGSYFKHDTKTQFAYIVYLANIGNLAEAERIYDLLEATPAIHNKTTELWAHSFHSSEDGRISTHLEVVSDENLWGVLALASIRRNSRAEEVLGQLQYDSGYDPGSNLWYYSDPNHTVELEASLLQIAIESKLLKLGTQDLEASTVQHLPLSPTV